MNSCIKKQISFVFLLAVVIITLEIGQQMFWNVFNDQSDKFYLAILGMDIVIVCILTMFSLIFNNTSFLDAYYYIGPLYRVIRFYNIGQDMRIQQYNQEQANLKTGKDGQTILDETIVYTNRQVTDVKVFIALIFVIFWSLSGFLTAFRNWGGFNNQDIKTTKMERKIRKFFLIWWVYVLFLAAVNLTLVFTGTIMIISRLLNTEDTVGFYDYEENGVYLLFLGTILIRKYKNESSGCFFSSQNPSQQQQNNNGNQVQASKSINRWVAINQLGDAFFWLGIYLINSRRDRETDILYTHEYGQEQQLKISFQNSAFLVQIAVFMLQIVRII